MKAVLLVDDDPCLLRLCSRAVRDHGAPVVCAENGHDALQLLRDRDDIGFVLSDIEMPGITGVEMLARMKDDEKLKAMPIVLMTGGHGARIPSGVRVLRKPFQAVQLRCLISIHLGGECPAGRTRLCEKGSGMTRLRSHPGFAPNRCVETCPDACSRCLGAANN
jgi:CheY-like chemotaxis protein